MAKVEFIRIENIEDLENIDIKDGQLLYVKNGKTFMDYGNKRIPTGSGGSDIAIGTEEDVTEDTKILIETAEIQNKGSEVVNTLEGNETYKAPSVNAVKNAFDLFLNKFDLFSVVGENLIAKRISDGTSLNTIVDTGFYYGNELVDSANLKWAYVISICATSDHKNSMQLMFPTTTKGVYLRYRINEVWKEWNKIISY